MYWISVAVLGAAHYFYRRGLQAEMACMMMETEASPPDDTLDAAETPTKSQGSPSNEPQVEPETDPLDVPGNLEGVEDPLERHKIYTRGIDLAYKKKDDPAMRGKAKSFAQNYIKEFYSLKDTVFNDLGDSRHVSVFKQLAIIYEDEQEFDKAVSLSNQALILGLEDGTKTGYQGRIDRLKKNPNKPAVIGAIEFSIHSGSWKQFRSGLFTIPDRQAKKWRGIWITDMKSN